MSSRNSSILATVIVVAIIGTLLLAVMPSFSQPASLPTEVWVNADWISNGSGDVVDAAGHVLGQNAFATINEGIAGVQAGGIVHVFAGTYNEQVIVDKSVTLSGANAGISATATRGEESLIQPESGVFASNGFLVEANDVTIDGFAVNNVVDPILVTGDGATIVNNKLGYDSGYDLGTSEYMINVTGSQATISGNGLSANQVMYAAINVTGSQATVSANDLEINLLGSYSTSSEGYGVLVQGGNAKVTDNTFNIVTSGHDIINVYGDNGVISGNTINSDYVYDYAIEYDYNYGDSTSNNGLIANNVLEIAEEDYPLIENNGNNTVMQGNVLNVNNNHGYYTIESYGSGNQIIGNTIGNEMTTSEGAIDVEGWNDNVARNNLIKDNTIFASYMSSDVIYVDGASTTITGNTMDSMDYAAPTTTTASTKPSKTDKKANSLSISGWGVDVTGAGNTISNNVIKNASEGVYVYGDYATVEKNQITDFTGEYGIYTEGTRSQITGNTIANAVDATGSWTEGVYNEGDFATINGNTIVNIYAGIDNEGYSGTINGNTIDNSQFVGYTYSSYWGPSHNWWDDNIYVDYGDHTQLCGNTILNNDTYFASEGIYVYEASDVTVKDNKITNVLWEGIDVEGYDYGANYGYTIVNNTITNTGKDLYRPYYWGDANLYAIYIEYGNQVVIHDNVVSADQNTLYEGLYLYECSNVSIDNNTINNAEDPMYLEYLTKTSITNNTMNSNFSVIGAGSEGIYAYYIGDGLTISGNKLIGVNTADTNDAWDYGMDLEECGQATITDNYLLNVSEGLYYYGLAMDESPASDSVIANNTFLNYADTYQGYGMELEYGSSYTVENNTLINNATGWNYGIYSEYGSNNVFKDNTIQNAEEGIYLDVWGDGIGYADVIQGNTIINNLDIYSDYGIYVDEANAVTVKDNTIDNTAGYWYDGIYHYGYNALIDGNTVKNATYGIYYDSENYPISTTSLAVKPAHVDHVSVDAHALTAEQIASLPAGQKDKYHTPVHAEVAANSVASAQSNLPVSDYATIQNNLVDNSQLTDNTYGIMYWGGSGAIADNTVLSSDSEIPVGIAAYADNVTFTGNSVSGITGEGSALVLVSANPESAKGNAYLADNRLWNNTVQMTFDSMDVFNMDNAGTVAKLDNSTLSQLVGKNTLDKAYWVVTADGDLKITGSGIVESYMYEPIDGIAIVYGDQDMANSAADLAAGDVVVEGLTSYTFDLPAGWSMISFPIAFADSQTQNLPSELQANLTDMWWWDGSTWWYYSGTQGYSPYYTHLTNVEPGKGYWVKLSSPTKFTVSGSITTTGVPTVGSGWTMVGVEGINSIAPATAYPSSLDMWYWDEGAWDYFSGTLGYSPYYAHITSMDPGKAYWVHN